MALLMIEEPRKKGQQPTMMDHPLFRLGFRPFYLLAAAFATISVPLWLARYFGALPVLPNVGLYWHMHEMVFGVAIAVIIGFLFTAGRNWTGLWTPRRGHLALLAGLWIAGRLAMLCAPPLVAALVDVAFIPAAAWPLYQVLKRAGNKRNMFLVVLLSILTLANIAFHTAVLGWTGLNPVTAVQAAILTVVMIESVIGGRVIPGFTSNAVPGTKPIVDAKRDKICLALTGAASIAWLLALPGPLVAALAIAAGSAQFVRLAGWKPHRTLREPLVWILHLSYAWIAIGFLLIGLAAVGVNSASAAFHALTVGSMAGLMIGMITRTALGHTGRQLKVGKVEVVMYALIQIGALARVCASVHPAASFRNAALMAAAACWAGAFLLYALQYGPYLCRARIDGREG